MQSLSFQSLAKTTILIKFWFKYYHVVSQGELVEKTPRLITFNHSHSIEYTTSSTVIIGMG
jgi:hypothetical protein